MISFVIASGSVNNIQLEEKYTGMRGKYKIEMSILIAYVMIDIVKYITGLNTTLVVTVLCIHCILNVNCLLTNIAAQMLNLE